MLSPLLTMVALTFAFSAILRQQVANYPVYFMTGSLLWNFFAQTTGHTANLTTDAMEMTKRIYLPRSVFVAAAVGGALVNLLLALIPLGLIMVATGFPIHATWLFLPVPILLGAVFTAGISLLVFTLACRFVDVRETYLVLVSTWFFATPIVYTAAIVPPKYQPILQANPMTHLVAVFRAPLYDGHLPDPATFGKAFLASLLALLLGWLFYASKIENYGSGR